MKFKSLKCSIFRGDECQVEDSRAFSSPTSPCKNISSSNSNTHDTLMVLPVLTAKEIN